MPTQPITSNSPTRGLTAKLDVSAAARYTTISIDMLTGDVSAISALADRIDGKVPLPTGQSDELAPTRLHISWKGSEPGQTITTVASPLLLTPPDEEAP
jgi:hypothetical protein